jgi:hypothetical protein
VLAQSGRAIVVVAQGQWNFGTLDEVPAHKRRRSKASLRTLAGRCGFRFRELLEFHRIGTVAAYLRADPRASDFGARAPSRDRLAVAPALLQLGAVLDGRRFDGVAASQGAGGVCDARRPDPRGDLSILQQVG